MTVRKCSTCKHYEPAPIWRKGWCRNPLLYSPQQSHLVGEDDLDCDRGMGNYWEPIDGAGALADGQSNTLPIDPASASWNEPNERQVVGAPLQFAGFRPPSGGGPNERGGDMGQYPPSGPRSPIGDGDDEDDVSRRSPQYGDPGRGGGDRGFTYYPEERYWTDYLRIAAPVLGVILLLGLAWFWINNLIGDDDPAVTPTPTTTAGAPIIPGGTPTARVVTGSPSPLATPPAAASGTQATATPRPASAGKFKSGDKAVVSNTGGSGANLRSQATTGGSIVTTLADGTTVNVTGDAVRADGYVWWPITAGANSGFVVEDFLSPSATP